MNVAEKFGFRKKNMDFDLKNMFHDLGVDKLKRICAEVKTKYKTKE